MHSACTSYTMTSSAATGRKMIVLPTTAVLVLFLLIPRLMRCPSTGRAVTKPLSAQCGSQVGGQCDC